MENTKRMASSQVEQSPFVKNSVLYKEFLAEREEILKHKWIESEKAGTISALKRRSSIGS